MYKLSNEKRKNLIFIVSGVKVLTLCRVFSKKSNIVWLFAKKCVTLQLLFSEGIKLSN